MTSQAFSIFFAGFPSVDRSEHRAGPEEVGRGSKDSSNPEEGDRSSRALLKRFWFCLRRKFLFVGISLKFKYEVLIVQKKRDK
jgi:hypothetical protein